MITTNERAVRMIEDTPDYYHQSRVFNAIMQANGEELGLLDHNNQDLAEQLNPATATWGISYWEERVGLPISSDEPLEQRRKKVLARIRSGAPFAADMLRAVIEAYTDRPVQIEFDIPTGEVRIIFDEEFNVDPELFEAVDNIIHAHLGIDYKAEWNYTGGFTYAWAYKVYQYPFKLFANTFLAGTEPQGAPGVPSTLGRAIFGTIDLLRSAYYSSQWQYKYAGNILAGGTEVVNTWKNYSAMEEVDQEYFASIQAYKACGTITAGTEVYT